MKGMQRLASFDLDNTLVNLDEGFRVWATEFVDGYGLDDEAVGWLIAIDRAGNPAKVVDAYALSGLEGIRKPDHRLFQIAAERCGMTVNAGG